MNKQQMIKEIKERLKQYKKGTEINLYSFRNDFVIDEDDTHRSFISYVSINGVKCHKEEKETQYIRGEFNLSFEELADNVLANVHVFITTYVKPHNLTSDYHKNKTNWKVCEIYAMYGDDEVRTLMLDHPSDTVRRYVALCGNDDHRKYLINDKDPMVRAGIAAVGTDEMRDALMHDTERCVKATVVKYGNDTHRDFFLNDDDSIIRCIVGEYGEKYRKVLENDKDEVVRRRVNDIRANIKLFNGKHPSMR